MGNGCVGGKFLWLTEEKEGNHNGCASILAIRSGVVWEIFSILGKAQTEYSQHSAPDFGIDSRWVIVWASFMVY